MTRQSPRTALPQQEEKAMAEDKDYLGEKLRLAERAREDAYFRRLDQVLIAQMRQQAHAEPEVATQVQQLFTSILVPVDFSTYSASALRYAAGIADRFAASVIVLHVITRETAVHTVQQRLGSPRMTIPDPLIEPYAPALPSDVEEVVSDLREQAYTALQAYVPAQLAKHPVELRVVVGHPFERILETAVRTRRADCAGDPWTYWPGTRLYGQCG